MEIQHLRAIWLETVDQSGQLVVRQMMLKTVRAVQIERVENRCPITRLEATPRSVAISGYIAHGAERGLLQQWTEEWDLPEDSHGARVGQSPRLRDIGDNDSGLPGFRIHLHDCVCRDNEDPPVIGDRRRR